MTSGNSFSHVGIKKKSWLYDTCRSASRKRVKRLRNKEIRRTSQKVSLDL